MDISAEKTKLMTNTSGIDTEIKVNGQKLQTVTSFKYLGSTWTVEGSEAETLSRIAQTTAALTRLKPDWNDRSISLSSKIRLMRSLVTSIPQRRIQAMEIRCYRNILRISYNNSVTNEEVRAKIQRANEPHEDLPTIVKRRKLQWYGYVFHLSDLAKATLQGTARQTEEEIRGQHQGMDRPGVRQVPEGSGDHGKMEETGCEIICGVPTTLAVNYGIDDGDT